MPNYATNVIELSGDPDRIREMLEKIKVDEFGPGTVDFNKIIPMPESLHIESGSRTTSGVIAYKTFVSEYLFQRRMKSTDLKDIPESAEAAYLRRHPEIKKDEWQLGKTAARNEQEYGAQTWYEWCSTHWNTKWPACGYEKGVDYSQNDSLTFDTAWDAPHPIIAKLAEMFPEIGITHSWADEDIGSNCGRYVYQDGKRVEEYFPETEVESIAFAAKVMGGEPEDWGYHLNEDGSGYINIEDMSEDERNAMLMG